MKTLSKNLLLLLLVLVICILPLVINPGAEYGGADGEAENLIGEISPEYTPWFNAIWEPPSGEIESLLFALQAAVGAAFIFYFFGYLRGKRTNVNYR